MVYGFCYFRYHPIVCLLLLPTVNQKQIELKNKNINELFELRRATFAFRFCGSIFALSTTLPTKNTQLLIIFFKIIAKNKTVLLLLLSLASQIRHVLVRHCSIYIYIYIDCNLNNNFHSFNIIHITLNN